MRRLRRRCEEGFTLIELLVVMLLPFHKQLHRPGLRPN
jgi:Prokaryotic N-terminal methylation motif